MRKSDDKYVNPKAEECTSTAAFQPHALPAPAATSPAAAAHSTFHLTYVSTVVHETQLLRMRIACMPCVRVDNTPRHTGRSAAWLDQARLHIGIRRRMREFVRGRYSGRNAGFHPCHRRSARQVSPRSECPASVRRERERVQAGPRGLGCNSP